MIEIELDIFSGRPNPVWSLDGAQEQELLGRLEAERASNPGQRGAPDRLGYRGYLLRPQSQAALSAFASMGLDSEYRLFSLAVGVSEQEAQAHAEAQSWLTATAYTAGVLTEEPVLEEAQAVIEAIAASSDPDSPDSEVLACSYFFTSSTDYSFWNASAHRRKNNCYNYASNWRTGTFAQPGRGSSYYPDLTKIGNLNEAAKRDGYKTACSGQVLLVAGCV